MLIENKSLSKIKKTLIELLQLVGVVVVVLYWEELSWEVLSSSSLYTIRKGGGGGGGVWLSFALGSFALLIVEH
jgi:hypothetical protein